MDDIPMKLEIMVKTLLFRLENEDLSLSNKDLLLETIKLCQEVIPVLKKSYSRRVNPHVICKETSVEVLDEFEVLKLPWALSLEDDGNHVTVMTRNVPNGKLYYKYHVDRFFIYEDTEPVIRYIIESIKSYTRKTELS